MGKLGANAYLQALLILFPVLPANSTFNQFKAPACTYTVMKALEYPINKYFNSEYYIKLDGACNDDNLRSICTAIRKERKIEKSVHATFHFVVGANVQYILMDNSKYNTGYRYFRNGPDKFNLSRFLDSAAKINHRELPKDVVGYWSSTSNPFIGLAIIYRKDSLFFQQNYYPNAASGYERSLVKQRIGDKDYFTFETDGDKAYYLINEYGDIELYTDSYGYKMAFNSTLYKVD